MQNLEVSNQLKADIDEEITMKPINMAYWEKNHKWTSQRKWIVANELDVNNFNDERLFQEDK